MTLEITTMVALRSRNLKDQELLKKAINTTDMLQRRMPNMCLAPNWCQMCKSSSESMQHLFINCTFASRFWNYVRDCFSWPIALPGDTHSLLCYTLLGHTFKAKKKLL